MSTTGIKRRLKKLEKAAGMNQAVLVHWKHYEERDEQKYLAAVSLGSDPLEQRIPRCEGENLGDFWERIDLAAQKRTGAKRVMLLADHVLKI